MSISPLDEAFIWKEMNINPKENTTLIIAEKIAEISRDYKFKVDLIDPLAGVNQTNTGTSVIEDLNRYFKEFKRSGLGTGARFEPFDTKSLRGRDKIRERLRNSEHCEVPFNNKVTEGGFEKRKPTLWIDKYNCPQTNNSFYRWRMKDDKPEQKWSHHPMAIEGLFKDRRVKAKVDIFLDDLEIRRRRNQSKRLVGYFKRR
jgi:hypothetical protein